MEKCSQHISISKWSWISLEKCFIIVNADSHVFVNLFSNSWKNQVTGLLDPQAHPLAVKESNIYPFKSNQDQSDCSHQLYPEGEIMDDLQKVEDVVHVFQWPRSSPDLVYANGQLQNDPYVFLM